MIIPILKLHGGCDDLHSKPAAMTDSTWPVFGAQVLYWGYAEISSDYARASIWRTGRLLDISSLIEIGTYDGNKHTAGTENTLRRQRRVHRKAME